MNVLPIGQNFKWLFKDSEIFCLPNEKIELYIEQDTKNRDMIFTYQFLVVDFLFWSSMQKQQKWIARVLNDEIVNPY